MESKMKWGWDQYLRPTPKNVELLLLGIKGFLGSSAVLALADKKPYGAVTLLFVGAFIDLITKFLGQTPEIAAVQQAEDAIKDKVEEAANEIIDERPTAEV